MVLAAGLGLRMRPITERMPKPLVTVGGKTLIDFGLDRLAAAGVESVVVNVHHFPDAIERHLASRQRPRIIISDERAGLLGTGGGVVKALPMLGDAPFFHLNSDSIWIDGVRPNLERLDRGVRSGRDGCIAAVGAGHHQHRLCRPRRLCDGCGWPAAPAHRARGRPFRLCGCRAAVTRVVRRAPAGEFSLNALFDRAIEGGRLHGLRLEGLWMHIGTPEAIAEAEAALVASAA